MGPVMSGRRRGLVTYFAGMCLASGIVYFLISAERGVRSQRDVTVPEGSIVYSIEQVANGRPLYRSLDRPPYATTAYAPLFYVLAGHGTRWLGGGIDIAYMVGRLLTLVATFACGFLVVALARRVGARSWEAWIGFVLVLANPNLVPWGYTARPDVLALSFALLGLWIHLGSGRRWRTFPTAACLLAAIYTKQSMVAAPVTLIVFLLWRRRYRRAAELAALVFGAEAAIFLSLDALMLGTFAMNTAYANVAPLVPWQAVEFTARFLLLASAPTVLLTWIGRTRAQEGDEGRSMFQVYAVVSILLAVVTCTKGGAAKNYFLEPTIALCVMAPFGVRWIRLRQDTRAGALMLVTLAITCSLTPVRALKRTRELQAQASSNAPVLDHLARTPGLILFGDAGLAVRAGRPILLLDKYNVSYMSDAGLVDVAQLVELLEQRGIAALVLDHPCADVHENGQPWWPREVSEAIECHYACEGAVGDQWLFRPRPRHVAITGRP